MPTFWLSTYHPLASEPEGPWRNHAPALPPYVDASCRREPDLESSFPTITGLSRPPSVRKLAEGDIVVYVTTRGPFEGQEPHRRLTAVLTVLSARKSHAGAGDFYREKGLPLPRNLLLPGNGPLPIEMTEGFYRADGPDGEEVRVSPRDAGDGPRVVAEWDKQFTLRKNQCQDVRICEPRFVDVAQGRVLDDATVTSVFGPKGFPNTQLRPAKMDRAIAVALLQACGLGEVAEALPA